MQERITRTEFSPELSASVVHGRMELLLAENMRRSAALKTDCSHCNSCPEMPREN